MQKQIAIVAGGDSGEYDISIKSGGVVKKHLDSTKYIGYLIHIKKGDWSYSDETGQKIPVDKNDFSITIQNKKIVFDFVFIAIHGTPGEDGKLQGYFDLLGLPYNSCDLITSAITFNKHFCKIVVEQMGVQMAKSVNVFKNKQLDISSILKQISLPCIVKPSNGGSSVATSRVDKIEELEPAIKLGFSEDVEVLIEEYISGVEITNGVFQYKGELHVLPITEIVTKNNFFDYAAKYLDGKTEEITPARISTEMEAVVKNTTASIYKQLNCKGMVRVDYIIKDNIPYFLEVNTVPGLSEASIIPQQAKSVGISLQQLFSMVIEENNPL